VVAASALKAKFASYDEEGERVWEADGECFAVCVCVWCFSLSLLYTRSLDHFYARSWDHFVGTSFVFGSFLLFLSDWFNRIVDN